MMDLPMFQRTWCHPGQPLAVSPLPVLMQGDARPSGRPQVGEANALRQEGRRPEGP